MRAIAIVGCPCRLEQMLRLPGLSATSEHQIMHAAAKDWRDEVDAELAQMAKVEEHLRAALETAGLPIGLDYGLRITHAGRPRVEGTSAITDPLDTPIKIAMRDVLEVFAERLKEDAARRRGQLDEKGLFMSRPNEHGQHVRFTAYSPQDRLLGKEDALARSLLTDAKTAASRARPCGEYRSAYAKIDRQQVAKLAALGWDRGELADLIMASCRDWGHPPTDLANKFRYTQQELKSPDPGVKGAATKRRADLIKWLKNRGPSHRLETDRVTVA